MGWFWTRVVLGYYWHRPLRLLGQLLLARLRLHLLHVDGVGLAAPHVELVVAHAQRQDALVDAHARREEHEVGRLLVDRLDDELAVVERDVADLRPREPDLGGQSGM